MNSSFSNILNIGEYIGITSALETRTDPNSNGNPIYIGVSPNPNASTTEKVWYIKKMHYDDSGKPYQSSAAR